MNLCPNNLVSNMWRKELRGGHWSEIVCSNWNRKLEHMMTNPEPVTRKINSGKIGAPSPTAPWSKGPQAPATDGHLLSGQREHWIRHKVHKKCDALASSPEHPHRPGPWKHGLPLNRSQMPRRLGTTGERTRTTAAQAPLQVAKPTETLPLRTLGRALTWDIVDGDGQDEQRDPPPAAAAGLRRAVFKENHFSLHGLCFHGKFCVELTTWQGRKSKIKLL